MTIYFVNEMYNSKIFYIVCNIAIQPFNLPGQIEKKKKDMLAARDLRVQFLPTMN